MKAAVDARPIENAAIAVAVVAAVLLAIVGCSRGKESAGKPSNASWSSALQSGTPTILTGRWENAENVWSTLSQRPKDESERKQWIQLQVRILQETVADPLKDEIRVSAIQEMYWNTEASREYLTWLKSGLESGFFKEARVRKKAEEIVHDLERGAR